jgi:membrane-bound lytic murein transglycosylase D
MTFAGHVVRKGDTLSSIAHQHGVPVEGIMEMNGLRTGKKLRVGTELVVPKPLGGGQLARAQEPAAPARAPAARPGGDEARPAEPGRREPVTVQASAAHAAPAERPTTLRVRSGDTLWSISRRLGVELRQLCRWNGIDDPQRHKLHVGAQLVVYGERG